MDRQLAERMARFRRTRCGSMKHQRYGRWIEVHWIPLPDGRRLIVHRDVTELKEREEIIARQRDAAERARRGGSGQPGKSTFLATMSHEDPHANERRSWDDGSARASRSRPGAAADRCDNARVRPSAVADHRRRARFFKDRGRPARPREDRVLAFGARRGRGKNSDATNGSKGSALKAEIRSGSEDGLLATRRGCRSCSIY